MRAVDQVRMAIAVGSLALLPSCAPAQTEADPAVVAAPVRVAHAKAALRQKSLSAFGTIEISPDHSRTISLPFDCVVTVVRAAAGQTVPAGAPMFEVRHTPAAALEQRRAAEALRFARSEIDRIRRLRLQNLATNGDVATAEQALVNAEASVSALGAPDGSTGSQPVITPIAGIVVSLDVEAGAVVLAGAPMARVGDAQRLQARMGVEVDSIADVREGAEVSVSDLQHRQSVTGRVTRVLRRVDPTTRLAEVTASLPSNAGFLPGVPVRSQITIGESRQVLSVPRSALVYSGDKPSVFVVQADKAKRREVTLGAELDDQVEIISGIDAGATVVIDGAANLEDGVRVAVQTASSS